MLGFRLRRVLPLVLLVGEVPLAPALVGPLGYIVTQDSMLLVFDAETDTVRKRIPLSSPVAGGLATSGDGRHVYVGVGDGVQIVDTAGHVPTRKLEVATNFLLAVSPDDRRLFSVGIGAQVSIVDLPS